MCSARIWHLLVNLLVLVLCSQTAGSRALAQIIGVAFDFGDKSLSGAEQNVSAVQAEVSAELSRILGETYPFWAFHPGSGPAGQAQIRSWLHPGATCEWEVHLEIDYGFPQIDKPRFHDVLFDWKYMQSNFGQGNPHAGQWKVHVGRQFSAILLANQKRQIRDALRQIPIGNRMELGKRVSGELGEYMPATLTPLKALAAQLTEAQFKLQYTAGREGNLYLLARSSGQQRPPQKTPVSINALVYQVDEPPTASLQAVDRLRKVLAPRGFLLCNESPRVDVRLLAK